MYRYWISSSPIFDVHHEAVYFEEFIVFMLIFMLARYLLSPHLPSSLYMLFLCFLKTSIPYNSSRIAEFDLRQKNSMIETLKVRFVDIGIRSQQKHQKEADHT